MTKVEEILDVISKVILALAEEIITLLETRESITKEEIVDGMIDLYKGQKESWRMFQKIFEGYKKVQDGVNLEEVSDAEVVSNYFT